MQASQDTRRDWLTGTQNQHALIDAYDNYHLSHAFVVLADVDDFHALNVSRGVEYGNALLRKIGATIVDHFGDQHTFRFASDEFVILGNFESDLTLQHKLAKLNESLAGLDASGSSSRSVSCSFGYAHGVFEHESDLHEALRLADRQMFEAKDRGKACAVGTALLHHAERVDQLAHTYKPYEHDSLTGLANTAYFHNQVAVRLATAGIGDDPLTIVHFNVQNFKGYNEEFGFAAGDRLLGHIAKAIEQAYPRGLVARASADQFEVATRKSFAIPGVEEVRAVFRTHVKDSSVWLKAGLYVVDDPTEDVGVVCDRAKLACDTIKGRRDVYYRVYDEALRRQIALNRYVLDHFDEALDNGYIKVYYQPIVHVATGEVCDEEALARWEDPKRGVLKPDEFIPVLEDARLIHKLDLYIVRRSCENMRLRFARTAGADIPSVSINLSRIDFELCDIVSSIESILDEYKIPHGYMSIEVTESALTGNQEFLKAEIDRFRADGFEVWMDDFGSGYSSLNLLKEYSFDLIKLDMDFLHGFETNEASRILLANVINLVKELNIKTLVEGVVTAEQLQFLKGLGCGKAQGFLFAHPQNLDAVLASIAAGTYPPIEPVREREFFSRLAHVNLMRPSPTASINGHYVTSDVPAAILLRQGGMWSYLNATEVFRDYLQRIGSRTLDESAELLNMTRGQSRARMEGALAAALVSGEWEGYTYMENNHVCTIRIKIIATNDEFDSTAVLAIAS